MNTLATISIVITLFYWALGTAVMMSIYSDGNKKSGNRYYIPVHWTIALISGIVSMSVLIVLLSHYLNLMD